MLDTALTPHRLWLQRWLLPLLALLAGLWLLPAQAQSGGQPQPVPALTARAMDSSGTLSAAQLQALEQQLSTLEEQTGAQVVVLMVPTTAPEDIASYAHRVASNWKIGRKDVGDGLLILVAKDDRRMRIEVARRLEGAVPDILAGRIIDDAMKPRFRANDYAGGLSAAIDQVGKLIRGEKLPVPPPPEVRVGSTQSPQAGFDFETLLTFAVFAFFIGMPMARAFFGKGVGSIVIGGVVGIVGYMISASVLASGIAGVVAMILTLLGNSKLSSSSGPYISTGGSGGWGSGGGGGGFSGGGGGGGFSSGGGGSFGGGGASGDW